MFASIVEQAKVSGDYVPVWKEFLRSKWSALVTPREGDPNFCFVVREFGPSEEPTVFLASDPSHFKVSDVAHAIDVEGIALIRMLQPEVAVAIVLGTGEVLGMPAGLVADLRRSAAN